MLSSPRLSVVAAMPAASKSFLTPPKRQGNFHDYPMITMGDCPVIETVIVDSDAQLGGIGEVGTPPIAPAVANAVFHATGKRLRELPLKLS